MKTSKTGFKLYHNDFSPFTLYTGNNTPAPKSPVIEYKLPPDELEHYRNMPHKPPTTVDGKRLKKPHNPPRGPGGGPGGAA